MSKGSELTRRRVLGGVLTIGGASAAAGYGTLAYFSDEADSADNKVDAGSLVLDISNPEEHSGTKTINVEDVVPGDSGVNASQITNNGTIDGYLNLEVENTRDNENSTNSAEQGAGDSGSPGELGDHLDVWIGLDRDDEELQDNMVAGQETEQSSNEWKAVDGQKVNDAEGSYTQNFAIAAGESVNLVMEWALPDGTGNEVQTDEVMWDVVVTIDQQQQ